MATVKVKQTPTLQAKVERGDIALLKEVKKILDDIWEELSQRQPQQQQNTISLPYQTLRYVDEVEKAFELSYQECPGNIQQRNTLKQIEIECHALEAGINARELSVTTEELSQAKSIFVALRILIKEFKEDRMKDGEERFSLFSSQLKRLVAELSEVF